MLSSFVKKWLIIYSCISASSVAFAKAIEVCKYLSLNETVFFTTPSEGSHKWTTQFSVPIDLSNLLNQENTKLSDSSALNFEISSNRSDVKINSLVLSSDEHPGSLTFSEFPAISLDTFTSIRIPITDINYVHTQSIIWTNFNNLEIVFSSAKYKAIGSVNLRHAQMCADMPEPSICTRIVQHTAAYNPRKCDCQVCHTCNCEKAGTFESTCNYGSCDSCWCAWAGCDCCWESSCGYECNCQICIDEYKFSVCEDSIHYGIGSLTPAKGRIDGGSNIVIQADTYQVFNNYTVECKFGAAVQNGTYLTSSTIGCNVPPLKYASPDQ